MKFAHLMNEIEAVQRAYSDYGFLEALAFIQQYAEHYSSQVRAELQQFMQEGAAFFSDT